MRVEGRRVEARTRRSQPIARRLGAFLASAALVLTGLVGTPDQALASHGGSPEPTTPPATPWWSGDKIVSLTGLPGAEYAELRWQWRLGLDRICYAGSDGDGWFCKGPQKHGIRYVGLANPYYTTGIGTNIEDWYSYVEADYTVNGWRSTASVGCWGEDTSHCAYPNDDYWHYPGGSSNWPPPISQWRLFETYAGANQYHIDFNYHYLQGCTYLAYNCSSTLYAYNGPNYHWDTGAITSSGLSLPTINTTGNSNLAPVVNLNAPGSGQVIHRNVPGDVEFPFTYTATDGDGHNWYGDLRLYEPGQSPCSDSVSSDCYIERDTLSGRKQPSSKQVSAEITLPRENGTYTWRARATDSSGWNGAPGLAGAWQTRTFQYIFNLPPAVPGLIAPLTNQVSGAVPTFVVSTVDPENDPYIGLIDIRDAQGVLKG